MSTKKISERLGETMSKFTKVPKALSEKNPAAVWLLWLLALFFSLSALGIRAEGAVPETNPVYGETPVFMEASYGYGDAAKGGRYIPVRVSLKNDKQDEFQGDLTVLAMESDYNIYSYSSEVVLKALGNETITINIPIGSRTDQLYVILKDSDGVEVMRQRLKLNVNPNSAELLIGVLSDTPEHLQYLDGVGIKFSTLTTKTVVLSQEMLPENAMGLDLLDVILITNYDTKRLSDAQVSAILEWVHKGGTLLLGTGGRVSDTLERFEPELINEPYNQPAMMAVDMGVEYATDRPGDSFINLPCADISIHAGNVILSNDELAVLTAVNKEMGTIAVAAYDFVDIEEFCQSRRSYVEKVFTSLLGDEKISRLSDYLYNGNSAKYWSAQSVINTGNVEKLPDILMYTVITLLYILLIGPGLYLFLKKKDLRNFYRPGVILISLVFTVIIYIMGSKTRFQDTFFTYATIKDVSGEEVVESVILNMRTPYNNPYDVDLNSDYMIRPLVKSYFYDSKPMPKFTGSESVKVSIDKETEKTGISVSDAVAFDPLYFELEKKSVNTDGSGMTGDITLFDSEISGTVTNHFDYAVENAAVMLYGQMILLGDLKPGETKNLKNMEIVNYPLGYSYLVAEYLSGSSKYMKADIGDPEYIKALERRNLFMYYMDNFQTSYSDTARIIAFSTKEDSAAFLKDSKYEVDGNTLLTSAADVNTTVDSQIYRSALMKRPTIVSGNYNPDGNTMYGVDPLILEYSLGNDLDVEKITINQLSEEFTDNEKFNYIMAFSGSIYFYNYDLGSYVQTEAGKRDFDSQMLKPYLSPSNTITVKYVPDNNSDYNWDIMLPMLSIVGREK